VNAPLRLAASLAFAVAVAACNSNGGTPTVPSAGSQNTDARQLIPDWQAKHEAYPACAGARGGGLFQCDALVYYKPADVNPNVGGLSAQDLETAYNLPSSTDGSGQIVAVVDAYDNPDVASDLATYRSEFNLGTANFTKYNQTGNPSDYPTPNKGWGVEIDLDVEMVSASCPNCTIYLIEANNNDTNNLFAAEKEAVKLGATIVTNSWGGGAGSSSGDAFDTPGVVYLASAGDSGYGMQDPADYTTVVSVGGTVLHSAGSGKYTETVWTGTGGGCSVINKPSWQHDPLCSKRTGNDIAAVAAGVAEYDSYDYAGWITIGGTSVASPLMAGVIGLAGNSTSFKGGKPFWKLRAHAHETDFNTQITGSMTKCPSNYVGTYICTAGLTGSKAYKTYSGPTGWGSPNGIAGF
jgi:hypothetical protein